MSTLLVLSCNFNLMDVERDAIVKLVKKFHESVKPKLYDTQDMTAVVVGMVIAHLELNEEHEKVDSINRSIFRSPEIDVDKFDKTVERVKAWLAR
jgi:hypothetical protein